MPTLHAPERIRSTADLRAFQRLMMAAVTRPLTRGHRTQRRWSDGRPAAQVIGSFSAPNDRLSALERIEIYNRMYWFRTLDLLHEDLPGLRAVLGARKRLRLLEAYLGQQPSRSFTLRDLPARLEKFIRATPRWSAPHTALAADMVAFEWAQIECYDSANRPGLTPGDIAGRPPGKLKLDLQPHLRLLALPIRSMTTPSPPSKTRCGPTRAMPWTWRRRRRVAPGNYAARNARSVACRPPARRPGLLQAVGGAGVQDSHRATGRSHLAPSHRHRRPETTAEQVSDWFATWMKFGWFCRRQPD